MGIDDDFESRNFLSLSEDISFTDSTSKLVAKSCERAMPIGSDNPNESPLPNQISSLVSQQEDGSKNAFKGGNLNGPDFMTYTFYLKNVGNGSCSYVYSIDITDCTKNLDAAIRLMVIHERDTTSLDSLPTSQIYAKAKGANYGDESGEPEKWTRTFASNTVICEEEVNDFYANSIHKFTVILWVEGWDKDTVNTGENSIVGGIIRLSMNFKITQDDEYAI